MKDNFEEIKIEDSAPDENYEIIGILETKVPVNEEEALPTKNASLALGVNNL